MSEAFDDLVQERSEASDRIVSSSSDKRLIVAGPGTGKTFTFKQALAEVGANAENGKGLALTFIRNLVADLHEALGDLADVFTFHGFCKHLMHRHPVAGLREGWDYYVLLPQVLEADLRLLGWDGITEKEIDASLHNLDDTSRVVTRIMELGGYYNAVSHTDLVYRVLTDFQGDDSAIPAYPLVVVDEYQDFSLLETSFLALLASRNRVLIAGDDDQALYDFKNASSRFIRELYADGEYEKFELPFCSRCTAVVVEAVNDLIAAADANGNLGDRIGKTFRCYLPTKQATSERHPKIIHAKCSVQMKNAPYPGQYIVEQIEKIPIEDIQESKAEGYPTVLVIGDKPFQGAVYDVVRERFPSAMLKTRPNFSLEALDGYRRIAKDGRSRLGWRIITLRFPFKGSNDLVREAFEADGDLVDSLPDEYRNQHLAIAELLRRLWDGSDLTDEQSDQLSAATGNSIDEIKETLSIVDDDDQATGEIIEEAPIEAREEDATILFTTLVGSKGLSASHVFILGLNNGFLPRDPGSITDEEVCKFLVALSRTRVECHVISCGRYAGNELAESKFLEWIRANIETRRVNKNYFSTD